MRILRLPIFCALVIAAAATTAAQAMPAPPPANSEAALAAKCKAASFARRPAGQMATTIREFQIKRCVKNNGFLD